ncbi:hypothetical protein TNCV_4393191 [Trichonephila clavipes]|nr:hypothetical protein TNCV_4393191 [Trichonephila clavipes]
MEQKKTTDHPESCTRAFGDGPRNFEPWSSNENDNRADIPSTNFDTTSTGGRLSFDIFYEHWLPMSGGFSVVQGSNS